MESVDLPAAVLKTGRGLLHAAVAAALVMFAAHVAKAADEGAVGQSLEQAASDPTASLMSVSVQDTYAGSYHQLDDESGNTLLLRSSVPFTTGSLEHIARATLPIVTDSPSGESGLSDLVLFDLIKFEKSWGRWGIGPVLLAPARQARTYASRSSRPVCRAIMSSSLVGIIQADTLLVADEMQVACASLAARSNCNPSQADASQILRRTSAECSPMPAVNTMASNPPSTAAKAPISRAAR
jgi:hypothetical protein